MTKEELFSQGWELTFSGPCTVKAWGSWTVYLHHISGRVVHGYGINEEAAFAEAIERASKAPERTERK